MEDFMFHNPTKIIFGRGKIAELGREIEPVGKRALFVYGQGSIRENGIYDQVVRALEGRGIHRVELPGVRSNPVLSRVYEGIDAARREKVDVLLAVGGGSVMDTAKAIAAGVPAEHDVWDFFLFRKTVKRALPVFTVPTVSASASEMNGAAVITKEEGARKFSARSPFSTPGHPFSTPPSFFPLIPPTAHTAPWTPLPTPWRDISIIRQRKAPFRTASSRRSSGRSWKIPRSSFGNPGTTRPGPP